MCVIYTQISSIYVSCRYGTYGKLVIQYSDCQYSSSVLHTLILIIIVSDHVSCRVYVYIYIYIYIYYKQRFSEGKI